MYLLCTIFLVVPLPLQLLLLCLLYWPNLVLATLVDINGSQSSVISSFLFSTYSLC